MGIGRVDHNPFYIIIRLMYNRTVKITKNLINVMRLKAKQKMLMRYSQSQHPTGYTEPDYLSLLLTKRKEHVLVYDINAILETLNK